MINSIFSVRLQVFSVLLEHLSARLSIRISFHLNLGICGLGECNVKIAFVRNFLLTFGENYYRIFRIDLNIPHIPRILTDGRRWNSAPQGDEMTNRRSTLT